MGNLTIWRDILTFDLKKYIRNGRKCDYIPEKKTKKTKKTFFKACCFCINKSLDQNVTWSRGMSRMSELLILSYRLKDVLNSYVLHCFWIKRIVHISATRCPIEMGFGSKCSILNGQVIYIEKSKLNIAEACLIPLERVTNAVTYHRDWNFCTMYRYLSWNFLVFYLKHVISK